MPAANGHTRVVAASAIDDNASCWVAELPPWAPAPSLDGDLVADVVVVGGGLTGTSAAWHLARRSPGLGIVLLEAKSLANGATGRSGGQVLNGVNGIEPRDAEQARRVRDATMTGIAIVEEMAAASSLDAGFRREGALEVATTARSAAAARLRVERARASGIPLRWIDAPAAGLAGAHGAVLDPDAARMNPAALVRGMREPLRRLGVEVRENSPVTGIREGTTIEVLTASGSVRAAAMVLATNAYSPSLGFFRDRILPLHSRVVATGPLDDATWSRLGAASRSGFADDLDRIAYGCRTPGGRLLFGGGSNAAYEYRFGGSPLSPPATARRFGEIESKLAGYFPAVAASSRVELRWSGPLAITFDRVCSIGVTGACRNVYYGLGYSGHGLALSALAGRVIADLHAGDAARWQGLPFVDRRLPWIPPEPLRWLGYQAYTRMTGRSPRRR